MSLKNSFANLFKQPTPGGNNTAQQTTHSAKTGGLDAQTLANAKPVTPENFTNNGYNLTHPRHEGLSWSA
jgi:hypothetical protein